MGAFRSQVDVPSRTDYGLRRIHPLRVWLGEAILHEAIHDYFQASPEGYEVTLACLKHVGLQWLEHFTIRRPDMENNSPEERFRMTKTDFGILVPIMLVEIFGADHIESYRRDNDLTRNEPIDVDHDRWDDLTWVTSFTQHRTV